MKYARTIELPDGAGVGVAPGPELGSSVAVGTLGAGVTSGSIEPSDGSGVGSSGGTVPSEPLEEQPALMRTRDRMVATRIARRSVWRFIGWAPWQW